MIRVAFVCDGFPADIDLSMVMNGNPGIGGTQYMFSLIVTGLHVYSDQVDPVLYTDHDVRLAHGVKCVVGSEGNSLRSALESDAEICVIRGNISAIDAEMISRSDKVVITWSHNYESYAFLRMVDSIDQIVANVCVGQQQLDRLRDDAAIRKSCVIFDTVSSIGFRFGISIDDRSSTICWLGSIVPEKGFHILARMWPQIKAEVPNVKLRIIGGGRLYEGAKMNKLGRFGLAAEEYEDSFSSFITDDKGALDPSIELCGILGGEKKYQAMASCSVGVVNPLGSTETFCLSAIEFESLGVPVVGAGCGGLLDTVVDGKTGYLASDPTGIKDAVIDLLENSEKQRVFGENAKRYVSARFDWNSILNQWERLLSNPSEYSGLGKYSKSLMQMDFKWVREINRLVKKVPLLRNLPSMVAYEAMAKRYLRK